MASPPAKRRRRNSSGDDAPEFELRTSPTSTDDSFSPSVNAVSSGPRAFLRTLEFGVDENVIRVSVSELLDPNYGLYMWPSAVCLAQYLWHHRASVAGRRIVELGAGTSLPGIAASMLSAECVVLTDMDTPDSILDNVRRSCEANGIVCADFPLPPNASAAVEERVNAARVSSTKPQVCVDGGGERAAASSTERAGEEEGGPSADASIPHVCVVPLTWAEYTREMLALAHWQPDILLGADVFYDSKLFDDLCATVHLFFRHNANCRFLVAYHDRGSELAFFRAMNRWEFVHVEIDSEAYTDEWADAMAGMLSVRLFLVGPAGATLVPFGT